MAKNDKETILYVSRLKKYYDITGLLKTVGYVRALDDVSFSLRKGETFGIVGETGCGKTTMGKTILRLFDATDGDIYFNLPREQMDEIVELETRALDISRKDQITAADEKELEEISEKLEPLRSKFSLTKMKSRELRKLRADFQPVFQDPFGSLDPRKLIKDIIAEPMKLLSKKTSSEIDDKLSSLIEEIGLSEDHLYRFPHEFSGGQRQRIGIARALSIEPKMLVLDEPTSALDVSVQAQILNIMKDVQAKRGMSFLFISHNLSVIKLMSDRVAVMYLGKIVELAQTEKLFSSMKHPYTKALLSAIPVPDPDRKRGRIILAGEIPSPSNPPQGCHFHPRCPEALVTCGWSPRDMEEPLKQMFDEFRNPEAAQLPKISELMMDEGGLTMDVVFQSPVSNEQLEIVRNLVDKERSMSGNIRFAAISSIEKDSSGSMIRMKMIKPSTPHLREIEDDHLVSCLLYEENKAEVENKDAGTEESILQR